MARLVENGELIGQFHEFEFRDSDYFVAGELHKHVTKWGRNSEVSTLIEPGVDAVLDRELGLNIAIFSTL